MVQEKTLYKSPQEIEWKCLNCGYIHKEKAAPKVCPACAKPQGFYMALKVLR